MLSILDLTYWRIAAITDGGEEAQEVSVKHSIIINKLKPYKNYTFYVRVYNGKSGSDQSEKVTCKTQDGGILCKFLSSQSSHLYLFKYILKYFFLFYSTTDSPRTNS